jgi:hypothetical protein
MTGEAVHELSGIHPARPARYAPPKNLLLKPRFA